MANIKSAKKRVKQNQKRRLLNMSRSSAVKTATKKVIDAIAKNDVVAAKDLFREAESKIARACGKGVLKRNTASRRISKLAKKIHSIESGQ